MQQGDARAVAMRRLCVPLMAAVCLAEAGQHTYGGFNMQRVFGGPNSNDIAQDAQDAAWQVAGEATEARAATSQLRAAAARKVAQASSKETQDKGTATMAIAPQAKLLESQTEQALAAAKSFEEKAKQLINGVEKRAYDSARAAAEQEVAGMEKESSAYYSSLEAELAALKNPAPDPAAAAAAKAAQPYIDTVLRVGALVLHYQLKVEEMAVASNSLTATAQALAGQAQIEQANGDWQMAQRHMIQAHNVIGLANVKKSDALKVRKLAESLNAAIPNYQKAAQMAAIHTLATFSGLQESKGPWRNIKSIDPWQTQNKIFEEAHAKTTASLHECDQAIAAMDAELAKVNKAVAQ